MEAVLFDLDGTLVDSVPWHEEALNMALWEVAGFRIGEFENKETFRGRLTRDKLYILLEQERIQADQIEAITDLKREHLNTVVTLNAVPPEDKAQMLWELKSRGYKLACVTNSNRVAAETVLFNLHLMSFFDQVITGSDVTKHKPSSEGYVLAMVMLGVRPRECVIVEDSVEGVTSARNTGAHVWEVSGADEVSWENLNRFLEEIK